MSEEIYKTSTIIELHNKHEHIDSPKQLNSYNKKWILFHGGRPIFYIDTKTPFPVRLQAKESCRMTKGGRKEQIMRDRKKRKKRMKRQKIFSFTTHLE